MRAPDTQALLSAWDAGHHQRPEHWALTMLSTADQASSAAAIATISIGQRDRRLFELRAAIFGHRLGVIEPCPHCHEHLEVDLNSADLVMPELPCVADDLSMAADDYAVTFRLPNTLDLIAIDGCVDIDRAGEALFERCVLDARRAGEVIAVDELPERIVERVTARMAELDAQADLKLSMRCPACRHEWKLVFDIVTFLWRELNAWALRTLRDVHQLAGAYGWSEAEILAMSTTRRRSYLQMVST